MVRSEQRVVGELVKEERQGRRQQAASVQVERKRSDDNEWRPPRLFAFSNDGVMSAAGC